MLLFQTGLVHAAQGKLAAGARRHPRSSKRDPVKRLSQAHWIARSTLLWTTRNWRSRGSIVAFAVRSIGDFYRGEPVWDPIRADPGFADFERRIGNAP